LERISIALNHLTGVVAGLVPATPNARALRKSNAQARIEGGESGNWPDDDYAVVEDTVIGRIYKERVLAGVKWRSFLQSTGAGPGRSMPPPNQGMANTLEHAQAALKKRYEEVKRRP
jgi:hypothetical protein